MTVLTLECGRNTSRRRTRRRRILQGASAVVLLTACACVPFNPSMSEVVGEWQVDGECGSEILDLRADGSYTYTIAIPDGDRVTHTGRWTITPKKEFLEGARIQLQNAIEPCSPSGERDDRQLEAVWEWGRPMLSFNPDLEGFTRTRR